MPGAARHKWMWGSAAPMRINSVLMVPFKNPSGPFWARASIGERWSGELGQGQTRSRRQQFSPVDLHPALSICLGGRP
jgi:hypothetical protein